MRKLGIYVQVPFCQTKCTYCNFHTGVVAKERFAPYVEAICREIREHRQLLQAAGVGLPANELQGLKPVERLRETSEVTLEADPETIEAKKAAEWAQAGINRVSFGVQSFSDQELAAAGRVHRRADVYRAAPILREAGIRNISFDLIAGLPHQTRESWR